MVVSYTSYELILGCFRSLPEATSDIIFLHLLTENHNINILIISFVAGFVMLTTFKRNNTQGGDKHCGRMNFEYFDLAFCMLQHTFSKVSVIY